MIKKTFKSNLWWFWCFGWNWFSYFRFRKWKGLCCWQL